MDRENTLFHCIAKTNGTYTQFVNFLKTALPRYADEKHNKRITFEGYSYNITTVSSK